MFLLLLLLLNIIYRNEMHKQTRYEGTRNTNEKFNFKHSFFVIRYLETLVVT